MKTLILMSGKAGSGKNTFAQMMANAFHGHGMSVGFESIAMPMKESASKDFSALADFLGKRTEEIKMMINMFAEFSMNAEFESYHRKLDGLINSMQLTKDNFVGENKTELSRILLQIYGTEIFQNRVDINYWDDQLVKRINESDKQVILITDVRFPSNIESLGSIGLSSFTIRVNRDNLPVSNHPSETALDKFKFNYTVENNGTIEDLNKSAKKVTGEISEFIKDW